MSALPDGVYTSHTLGTDGRSVVTPDTGAEYGNRSRVVVVAGVRSISVNTLLGKSSGLPAGVYTSHALTVDGRSVITPDTGDQYGYYGRAETVVVLVDPTVPASVSASKILASAITEAAVFALAFQPATDVAAAVAESAAIKAITSGLAETLAAAITETAVRINADIRTVTDTLVAAVVELAQVTDLTAPSIPGLTQAIIEAAKWGGSPPDVVLSSAALEAATHAEPDNALAIVSSAALEAAEFPDNSVVHSQACIEVVLYGRFKRILNYVY